MAYFIDIPTITDDRGSLSVLEKLLPFEIKRVYFIHGAGGSKRGGHRHKESIQATICVHGSVEIMCDNGKEQINYLLDSPEKCLMLEPHDWHVMHNFSSDSVLLVLASNYYDKSDYIYESY